MDSKQAVGVAEEDEEQGLSLGSTHAQRGLDVGRWAWWFE